MLRALTGGLLTSATGGLPGQSAIPAAADASPPPPPWREHADAYLDLALPEESHAAALAALHDRGATGLMELVRPEPSAPPPFPRHVEGSQRRIAGVGTASHGVSTARAWFKCMRYTAYPNAADTADIHTLATPPPPRNASWSHHDASHQVL
jgi:hypothetical protein